MASNISPDVFSSVLGQIYECALFPERWPATIETIRRLLPDMTGLDFEQPRLLTPAADGNGEDCRKSGEGEMRIAAAGPGLDAILIGHLRRAASIGRVARDRATASALHEAHVDGWGSGVLLVDEALYLIRANRAGEGMIESGNPVRLRHGCLELRPASAQQALEQAVAKATGGGTDEAGAPINFIAVDDEGAPAVIQVMAMREDMRPSLPVLRSAVAIVLISPMTTRSPPQQALGALYGLTPAEARVLHLLGEGSTLADIASALQSKRSTVKTHLLRIFAKTSTNRQADLVRLVHSLSSPV